MPTNNKKVEIELNRANTGMAEAVAAVLKKPIEEVVSSCLRGSTNLLKKSA